jgi:hydroxymethylpyrimidine/phosphomethylpyrimidine kinase
MVHNVDAISAIAQSLNQFKPQNIVIDPVMTSKNGCNILEMNTLECLQNRLFPYATLITPNIHEAEILSNTKIDDFNTIENVASQLGVRFNTNILIKGGHLLNHSKSSDVLYLHKTKQLHWFNAHRINTSNTHGTGCTYSSAIASHLAQGKSLFDAVTAAKNYISLAIQAGKFRRLGHGIGPVDHFYLHRETTP